MRILRRLCCAVALALPLLAAGCGGTVPPIETGSVDMAHEGSVDAGGNGAKLALFSACTTNDQCDSGLCTQTSYDRSTTPLCTYMCDNGVNPKCPNGCNMKNYCKMPTK